MRIIDAIDLQKNFLEILENREEVLITINNELIARLIPEGKKSMTIEDAIKGIKSLKTQVKKHSKKIPIKKLINEGRKY